MRPRDFHVADKLRRYREKAAWKRCFVASGLVPDGFSRLVAASNRRAVSLLATRLVVRAVVGGIGPSVNRPQGSFLIAHAGSFSLWKSRMKTRSRAQGLTLVFGRHSPVEWREIW